MWLVAPDDYKIDLDPVIRGDISNAHSEPFAPFIYDKSILPPIARMITNPRFLFYEAGKTPDPACPGHRIAKRDPNQ